MRATMIPTLIAALETVPTTLKKTETTGNRNMNQDSPSYSIVKIGQNAEKSTGGLRRRAVTQTPVKDHQPTLECKSDRK